MTLTKDMLMKMSVADKNKLGRSMLTGMKKHAPKERPCTGCVLCQNHENECSIRWKAFYDKNGEPTHECWYPEGLIPADDEREEVDIEGRQDKGLRHQR